MKQESSHKYDDIIRLPHPVSAKHPQMSMHDRAAQFSPFAALTGHEDHIAETARLTDPRMELDEYELAVLDEKLHRLQERLDQRPQAAITYFQPDERKEGGAYLTVVGAVRRIDAYRQKIALEDGTVIAIDRICDIEIVRADSAAEQFSGKGI